MAITQGDGSIILKTKVDTAGINAGMKSIKSAVSTIGKSFLAVSAIAATSIITITKKAVDAYAEYEQLVGGVETLFKDSSEKIIKYASEAYRTAGVSANEYMKNVTAFSASLISSTAGDTEKAADIANMAMIDMSDNANKMGSSMESVTLAYQGFAKQQYMLLDNLKLGYGGTKTEMERLLEDAQALTGVKYDINNLADVYSAIHAIQEELGIAGTTAKEAATTISGSAAMMKASWQDVLSAIAGGGDIDKAVKNFSKSVSTYFKNIVPVIKSALSNVGEVIAEILPDLIKMLAKAIVEALPLLLEAIWDVLVGLLEGIVEGIASWFSDDLPDQMDKATDSTKKATKEQKKLTDQIKKTTAEQKKALAGFDEINTFYAKEVAELGGNVSGGANVIGGNIVGSSNGSTSNPFQGIYDATSNWSEFWHEVKGDLDIASFLNLDNAGLKLTNSVKQFGVAVVEESKKILSSIFGDVDTSELVADAIKFGNDISTSVVTGFSGIFDVLTGIVSGEGETAWEGFGKIVGSSMQGIIPVLESIGYDAEGLRRLFYPIYEDVPNLFKTITASQAEAIKIFSQIYDKSSNDLKQIISGNIITDDVISKSESSLKTISDSIVAYLETTASQARADLGDLLTEGFITEEEYENSLAMLEKTSNESKSLVEKNQNRIVEILKNASNDKRKLTFDEQKEINKLLSDSNEQMIATISAGSGTQEEILEKLNEYEGTMTRTHLSEIIQLTNKQYEEKVASAEAEYKETVDKADRAYYELGAISEEQKNEIIKKAKEKKNGAIEQAKQEKDGIVKQAQEAAGELAKYVDPESGEIISEWEAMWNSMYAKAKIWIEMLGSAFTLGMPSIFGVVGTPAIKFKVPALASGAVLPPNRPFFALLGDNKNGRNLEAPESLIRQIVREEAQRPTNFTVTATGSMSELIRLLNLEIKEEQVRTSVF